MDCSHWTSGSAGSQTAHTLTSQLWTSSQCITHRDQSALDFLTVHHTQGPVSSGLPHSASHTGTSQLWTSTQCIIHRDQSALDCLTVYHTHIQGLVSGGNTCRYWSVVVTSGGNTYRDWSVVVTHAGTGQWW